MTVSSCCTFCKGKVFVKSEYVYPEFNHCVVPAKGAFTYKVLNKTSAPVSILNPIIAQFMVDHPDIKKEDVVALLNALSGYLLSPENAKILLDNLAMKENEVGAYLEVLDCYFLTLQLFNAQYGEKK